MKKQKLYPFTVGTGMTIENSTPEERKEIADLIANENPENYGTYLSKYCNEMHLREIKFCNGNFDFPKKSVSKVTNPLTYSQMKALITGERTKLTHAQAVEKLKGGAQLYIKEETKIEIITKLFPNVSKYRFRNTDSVIDGYAIKEGSAVYFRQKPIQGVEIIELGDIEEEQDAQIAAYSNILQTMISELKEIDKSNSLNKKEKKAAQVCMALDTMSGLLRATYFDKPIPDYTKGSIHNDGLIISKTPKGKKVFKGADEFNKSLADKLLDLDCTPIKSKETITIELDVNDVVLRSGNWKQNEDGDWIHLPRPIKTRTRKEVEEELNIKIVD